MENSKVVDVTEWEHTLIFRNVIYEYITSSSPVCTDLDEQHSIKLFLTTSDDVAGHVASPTKEAYDI